MIATHFLVRVNGCVGRSLRATTGLLLIILLGFAVRVYHLDFAELAGDEGFGYVFIQRPYHAIVADTLAMREPHPVGSYFLQKAWAALVGISEFALRFPGAWFGVLAIALAWRLARELGFGRDVSLWSAGLMALGPFAVFYSREMRMYSMLLALTLASTLLMWLMLRRASWRIAAAYVVVSWLALQMHYYAGFVFVAQNAFVLGGAILFRSLRERRALVGWVAAQSALLACSLPWLIVARDVLVNYRGAVGINLTLVEALTAWLSAFLAGPSLVDHRPALAVFAAALIAVAFFKLLFGRPPMRLAAWLLALHLFVPLVIAWVASLNRPIFAERYSIAALAPLQALLAIAGAHCVRFRIALPRVGQAGRVAIGHAASVGISIALAVVTLAGLHGYLRSEVADGHPRVWHGFIGVVNRYALSLPASDVRIALNFPDPVFTYYHHRYLPAGPAFITLPYRAGDAVGAREVAGELRTQGVQRVLLQIVDSFWDGQGIAASALESEFVQVEETYSGRWIVKIYGRPGDGNLRPLGVKFIGGPVLEAAYARVDVPGRLVEVYLRWADGPTPLNGAEKIFIHVGAQDDPTALIGQRDELLELHSSRAIPVNGARVHGYGVRLNEALPPGRYHVRVGLYDPSRDGAPRLLTDDGRDALVIASFAVE